MPRSQKISFYLINYHLNRSETIVCFSINILSEINDRWCRKSEIPSSYQYRQFATECSGAGMFSQAVDTTILPFFSLSLSLFLFLNFLFFLCAFCVFFCYSKRRRTRLLRTVFVWMMHQNKYAGWLMYRPDMKTDNEFIKLNTK